MEIVGAVEVKSLKTYAIGDIHGAYKSLIQCFERSKFDYKKEDVKDVKGCKGCKRDVRRFI